MVTGGNRGIGEAISKALVREGYRVVLGARTEPTFADGSDIVFVATDVRDPASLEGLASAAAEVSAVAAGGGAGRAERIDLWVNCAGYSAWRPLAEVDEAFFDDMLDTNLKGTFFGCKTAAARMANGGAIVNISSIAGRRGSAGNSVYCASKFGVTGLTQALAKELGPRGIRVNAVCPVYVRTDGLVEALEDGRSPAGGQAVDEYLARFADEQSALKRLPTGDEVAAAVVWLASDAASAVTGQSLHVDCGVMPA